ncbi:MAG: PKD domain-containing protein, partial [Candidatus Magnetoglobus multicellularis str. Araruama]
YNVSISGDYAIVGARYDDDNGGDSGSAYIFKRDGTTWSEVIKLTPTDGVASDYFGYQVSISNDYAIVGAYFNDDKGIDSGAAYIYERNGSDWSLLVKQTGSDSFPDDRLGYAVAMSASHAIVGAYYDDDMGSNSGSAYIYELNTQPTLVVAENTHFTNTTDAQSINLTIVDCDGSDITITAISSNPSIVPNSHIDIAGFGSNTIVSDTTAGASTYLSLTVRPSNMTAGETTIDIIVTHATGLTSVSTFNVTVSAEEEKITATDGYSSDHFGYALAMSGDYAVVGARYDDDRGSNSGAIYVYHRKASGWYQHSKIIPDDGTSSDYFGEAVAMNNDYMVVGAPYDDNSYTDQGSAYIYKRNGNNWVLETKIYANDRAQSDYFGRSVSISGNWIIIGAAYDDNSYSEQGSAYIFKTDGTQVAKLYASDYAASDYFGVAVSISGDYAIIGAYYDDDYYSNSGSAYIFYYNGTSWTQQAKLTASDGYSSDYFGQSVFISDDYAIIGAQNNDANGSNSGAAYIFQRDGTSWNQMAKLTAGDALTSDNFGCSVYLKAGYAIVGAKNNDHMATNAGAAYIFKQTGSQWVQLKTLNASDAYASDYFGHSV